MLYSNRYIRLNDDCLIQVVNFYDYESQILSFLNNSALYEKIELDALPQPYESASKVYWVEQEQRLYKYYKGIGKDTGQKETL